jgi:hypothetical protein
MVLTKYLRLLVFVVMACFSLFLCGFNHFKKVTPSDSWFLLLSPTAPSNYQSQYLSYPYNWSLSYSTTKYTLAQVQSSLICPAGTTAVCAVKIDYTMGSPVSALDDDDFSYVYEADILGYVLRRN